MKDRLKELRKALGLTQQEFADRIGVHRGNIATYETRDGSPGSSVITLICREFGVREEWLRTGEGPMFAPAPSSALDALAAERHLSRGDYVFLEKVLEMSQEKRQIVMDFMMDFAKSLLDSDTPAAPPAAGGGEDGDVAAAEALYERGLGFAPSAGSTASNTTGDTEPEGQEKIG